VRGKINELGTVGLRLGTACAGYFWAGWVAWSAAGITALYAEYHLRAPQPPTGYLLESTLGILLPFLALGLADNFSLESYLQVWRDLQRHGSAPRMLDSSAIEHIRAELRTHPALRWFAPPESKSIEAQLMTTALWYKAVALPPAAGFKARYGEWLLDTLGGYGALLCFIAVGYLWLNTRQGECDLLWHLALLGLCLPLTVLGRSVIRFAARRQAILDYFRTWRLDSMER
jgi:hypothetical protein